MQVNTTMNYYCTPSGMAEIGNIDTALAGWFSWLECCLLHQKVEGQVLVRAHT